MIDAVKLTYAALASATALAFSVPTLAQSSGSPGGDSGGQTKAFTAPSTVMPSTNTSRGAADNTNSKSGPGAPDDWADVYSKDHQGRISRQAYMAEMGRRFDATDSAKRGGVTRQSYLDDLSRQWQALDRGDQGLTPAEVSRINGRVDVPRGTLR